MRKAHAAPIKKLTADADRRSVVGSKVALRAEMEKSADAVEILIGDVTEEKNPMSGAMMYRRSDVREAGDDARVRHVQGDRNRARARRPTTFPPSLTKAIDNLRAHGIVMTPLKTAQTVQIEEFTIQTNKLADRAFEEHNERTLTGTWARGRARAAGGHAADRYEAAAGPARVLPDRAALGRRAGGLESAGRGAGRGGGRVSDRQDAELSAVAERADGRRNDPPDVGRSARRSAAAAGSGQRRLQRRAASIGAPRSIVPEQRRHRRRRRRAARRSPSRRAARPS